MSAQTRAELDSILERIGSTPFVDHETLKREGARPVHRLTVQWVGDDGARTLRMESPRGDR